MSDTTRGRNRYVGRISDKYVQIIVPKPGHNTQGYYLFGLSRNYHTYTNVLTKCGKFHIGTQAQRRITLRIPENILFS